MEIWQAIILGIIEGLTEFLPVSSTGHLTIAEGLMGMSIDDPSVVAFTAIIQIGAILAAVIYFWKDIWSTAVGWLAGIFDKSKRSASEYKFGWAIIIGSIPIAIIGLTFADEIETILRSLWFVVAGLVIWSGVMWWADRRGDKVEKSGKTLKESQVGWRDTLAIGLMQCVSLIPGVSRSGATISAGLLRGFDRVTATRLSFFLGIPALVAAGLLQIFTKAGDISAGVGWAPTIVATIVSFVVGYASIAWLLKYVSSNNFSAFIKYRLALGAVIALLLVFGVVPHI